MHACLERVGLAVRWEDDCSRSHRAVADSLTEAFAADATEIAEMIGRQALEELLGAHRLWSDWLRKGRVRKLAIVAEKTEMARSPATIPRARERRGSRVRRTKERRGGGHDGP
jgi:hypothetical protein